VFAIELATRGPDERRALAAASSWATWESLRAHQELSLAEATAVVRRTMLALLRT
jgi:hypothetical protein